MRKYLLQTSWDKGNSWHTIREDEGFLTLEECQKHVKFQKEWMNNSRPWRIWNKDTKQYMIIS